MEKKPYQKEIERELGFLLEKGFEYIYTYDKGSDSSCVYIYRFMRGRDFLDLRAVSGGGGTCVAFIGGEYKFPNFKLRHKKAFRAFQWRHLFKKPSVEELWAFAGELLRKECEGGELFGLKL